MFVLSTGTRALSQREPPQSFLDDPPPSSSFLPFFLSIVKLLRSVSFSSSSFIPPLSQPPRTFI